MVVRTHRSATGGYVVLASIVVCLAFCRSGFADGWHNTALATATLDEWMADVKAAIPDIEERIRRSKAADQSNGRDTRPSGEAADPAAVDNSTPSAKRPAGAGTILADMSPQQQALLGRKAKDCLEIMAYMDANNIIPREFPRFDLKSIPKYRTAAKELMKAMGPEGARPLVGVIQNEMAGGRKTPSDMKLSRTYYDDLLEVLQHNVREGNLSDTDVKRLMQAGQGSKSGLQKKFSDSVRETVLMEDASLNTMLDVIADTNSRTLRTKLNAKIRERINEADVLELLHGQLSIDNDALKRAMASQLNNARPRYREVRPDLDEIWKLTSCEDPDVAMAAVRQVQNAYLQAGVSDCMDSIARGDEKLNLLIWEQLDFRIDRAKTRKDTELLGKYRGAGMGVLTDSKRTMPARTAAIELLSRLKDRQTVGSVNNALPKLPRELWPKVGGLLKDLTGEDFGPREGDDTSEAFEAMKKWREWWKKNRGNGN